MFRPCIDLRHGAVVQIVGGTLDDVADHADTNFTSDRPAEWYATKYRNDNLRGGHIVKLGPGNDQAATSALAAWPDGMQIGGGITATNAAEWLDRGASHVIVTSHLFVDGQFSTPRLAQLVAAVGKQRLVIDLSCRFRDSNFWVVTDRWQQFTALQVNAANIAALSDFCAEFLVHGVDVEGLSQGIDLELVSLLAAACPIPCTYAGGARSLADLELVDQVGEGRIDLTIGSALDIFGGNGVTYDDCVAFNGRLEQTPSNEIDDDI